LTAERIFFAGDGFVAGTGSEGVDFVAAFVFRVRSLLRRVISTTGVPLGVLAPWKRS
jgi:hypothetical protein